MRTVTLKDGTVVFVPRGYSLVAERNVWVESNEH